MTSVVKKSFRNWTSSTDGEAMVGHHNPPGLERRRGLEVVELFAPVARPGNSGACSQEGLRSSAGNGLFYGVAEN